MANQAIEVKKRSPIGIILLMIITFGIYAFVWWFKTAKEVKGLSGVDFPSWGILIPLYNIFIIYTYVTGIEKISEGKKSAILLLILWFVIGPAALFLIQDELNKHATI